MCTLISFHGAGIAFVNINVNTIVLQLKWKIENSAISKIRFSTYTIIRSWKQQSSGNYRYNRYLIPPKRKNYLSISSLWEKSAGETKKAYIISQTTL